jgi:hypothetical protein
MPTLGSSSAKSKTERLRVLAVIRVFFSFDGGATEI